MSLSPSATTVHDHVVATAKAHPEAWAVHAPGHAWRWSDLVAHVQAAAGKLRSLNIGAGDRLVIVSENSASTVALLLAAQSLGAWPAVINARLPLVEVQALADCADTRWVLFSTEGSKAAAAHAQALGAAVVEVPGLGPLAAAPHASQAAAEQQPAEPSQRVGMMIFTSGTTGRPKAVMISHACLLNLGRVVGGARQTQASDTIDVAAPLSHVMGVSSVMAALMFGAAMRLNPRLAPDELVHAIARGEVTQASMVPMGWARLADQIETHKVDLSRHAMRTLTSGGAPLDPALKARVEKLFNRPLVNAYGMTECAPLARAEHRMDVTPWSVGRPEATVEVRIVDENNRELPPGDVGEIQARGPGVMMGYFRNPVATEEVMRDGGWFVTGDLGRWLPDGDFAVVGRRKEMIIRSGFNVYPAEVEAAIASHPAVQLTAVGGQPLGLGDEAVVAFVQLKPGADLLDPAAALQAHVRERLAPYKCPSRFILVDAMPVGATGKILKRELLAGLAESESAGTS